ncbi:MAG TPA: regulatory protein RecX [Candidatus Deferrimicrobium sp.]|nr:regulatory protein RecX [Candidatus Deferrimicrobium sp.]
MADEAKILKLDRQKSDVLVSISTREEPIILPEEAVYHYRLQEGVAITPAQVDMLLKESEKHRCSQTAAQLLAAREQTVGQLWQKLANKRFSSEAIREAVHKYKDLGVLDDARLAHRLASNLVAARPCGTQYLVAWLRARKIDRHLAEQTAAAVLTDVDENSQAEAALTKRWRAFAQFDLETSRRKAYSYLARRGFGYEVARAAFEKLRSRQDEVAND